MTRKIKYYWVLSIMLFSLFQLPSSEAAITVQLPAEPWLCDPVRSCAANANIMLTGELFSGKLWVNVSEYDRISDDAEVKVSVSPKIYLNNKGSLTYCWNRLEVNIGTFGDLKKLTQSFTGMSPDDVLTHKFTNFFSMSPNPGCTTAMIKRGWIFESLNKFEIYISAKLPNSSPLVIASNVLDYDLSATSPPPVFESCHAIRATNMIITGVANRESEGVANIKPYCPATVAALRITVGNQDYSDNKIDINFDDGRSESLTLTIDDKPANIPVQLSSPFNSVQVRGKLPPTAAGKGAGVAWVKVEFW